MPIYDITCRDCGFEGEVIVSASDAATTCPECGSLRTTRGISATSSLTGKSVAPVAGPGDTGCCGSAPGHSGCAGPGSCCGRTGGR
jgi:putative FmdB family regulatory protein